MEPLITWVSVCFTHEQAIKASQYVNATNTRPENFFCQVSKCNNRSNVTLLIKANPLQDKEQQS